jgi:hypothetical protein
VLKQGSSCCLLVVLCLRAVLLNTEGTGMPCAGAGMPTPTAPLTPTPRLHASTVPSARMHLCTPCLRCLPCPAVPLPCPACHHHPWAPSRHRYAGGDTSDCDSQDGDDTQQQQHQQPGHQQQQAEGDATAAAAGGATVGVSSSHGDEADLDDAAVCTSMDEDELQHQLCRLGAGLRGGVGVGRVGFMWDSRGL